MSQRTDVTTRTVAREESKSGSSSKACLLGLGMLFLVSVASAWISAFHPLATSTHKPMADRAVALLSEPEFKDIHHFSSILRKRADHEGAHVDSEGILNFAASIIGAAKNGGPAGKYWTDAQAFYQAQDFERCYLRIGWLAHLVEDEAAPAHGANISHGKWKHDFTWPTAHWAKTGIGDNCEWYATHRSFENVPILDFDAAVGPHVIDNATPDQYCDLMIRKTRNAITNAFSPPEGPMGGPWTNYWLNSGDTTSLICEGQNSAAFGQYGTNRFPDVEFNGNIVRNAAQIDTDFPPNYFRDHSRKFLNHRTTDAIEWTAGMFLTASKSLKPLIVPLDVGVPIFTPHCEAPTKAIIRFRILENRKSIVQLSVKWDGVEQFTDGSVTLLEDTNSAHLPWQKPFTFEIPTTGGPHTLRIKVIDADNLDDTHDEDPVMCTIVGQG